MELEFTKMEGLGNDFVVLDGLARPVSLDREAILLLADRRRGVGCDQVLLIEPSEADGVDVRYRIFNPDGSEAEQCGNGARCIARYLHEHGWCGGSEIMAETVKGRVRLIYHGDGRATVDMGPPLLEPAQVPFIAEGRADRYGVEVNGETLEFGVVSMGNPHAVLLVEDVECAPVARLGPQISRHERFPQGVNAGFMQVLDPAHIRLRVFERGAGETQACGSGACAAVVAGRLLGKLDPEVDVELPGGHLNVRWEGDGHPVWMSGPARQVFEGRISL